MKTKLKNIIYLASLFSAYLCSPPLWAASESDKSFNDVKAQNSKSRLMSLIENDANLKTHYNSCQSENENDLPKCIWEKIQSNSELVKKVKAAALEDRKEVPAAREGAGETTTSRSPASTSDGKKDTLEPISKDATVKVDTGKDPFILKLQENIGRQLDAIFTTTPGEVFKDSKGKVLDQKSRTFLATDHSKFAALYNTHLSNSIVQSMSSFCSEAEYNDRKFIIYKNDSQRKAVLEKNIQDLSSANLTPPSAEYKELCKNDNFSDPKCQAVDPCTQGSPAYNKASCHFNSCLPAINKLCYEIGIAAIPNSPLDDQNYTKTRACEVMEFVKSARATIMALDKQEKFYKENTEQNNIGMQLKGLKDFKSEGDVSRNSQDIVTITSDVAKKANEDSIKEFDNLGCVTEGPDGKASIANEEACKKLVIENKENAQKAVVELNFRRQVQLDEIEQMTTVDELKKYLIAEGDSDESANAYIAKITKEAEQKGNISVQDLLKQKIKKKYEEETKAIVQGLADKIKHNSVEATDTADNKAQKYLDIQNELKSKGERYTNMLHYSNIVSSYLTLTDSKSGKSSANANQLYRELASRKDLQSAKQIQENAQKAGLNASKEETSATTLDIKTINEQILNKNN